MGTMANYESEGPNVPKIFTTESSDDHGADLTASSPVTRLQSGKDNLSTDDHLASANKLQSSKCKKVGQYLLGPTLGEGSYGKIHLATHFISKQQVAIKVVAKKTLVQREVARRHFRREALLLQQVSHPNVVRLYEAMETSNSYYLVFELASGGCILDLITQRGCLQEDESRHYMRQIASSVDHLHRTNIVHRDIKLENLLLDGNNNIKLVDFGLSAVCHDTDHHLSTLCGSPVYAAPELFAGRKYGKGVDIWGIGVCFFAMLTGKLPFLPDDKTSLPQLYSLILKGFTMPVFVSQDCQLLLGRLLEHQEGRRINAEELLSHPWMTQPEGRPVSRVATVPKRLPESAINTAIVKYMCSVYGFNENDVISSVVEKKLTAVAATYNILKDGVENDQITIALTNHTLNQDTPSAVKKSSSTLPRLDTRILSGTSSATNEHWRENVTETDTMSNNLKSESQQDRKLSETYKSCILVLKRARQHIRHGDLHLDPHNNVDYVVVGKSPRHSRGSILSCLSPHAGNGHTTTLTLPPIAANHLALSGNLRYVRGEAHDRKHQIHLDRQGVSQLDVKGVSPSLFDRSSLTHAGSVSTNLYAFNQGYIASGNPPPPPPPSTFGDGSSQSRHSSQSHSDSSHNNRKLSHLSPHRETKDNLSPNFRDMEELTTSQLAEAESMIHRDPIRPSLAALRDPFGRNTCRRSHHSGLGNGLIVSKSNLRKPNIKSSPQTDSPSGYVEQSELVKSFKWRETTNNPPMTQTDNANTDFLFEGSSADSPLVFSDNKAGDKSNQLSPSKFLQQFHKLNRLQDIRDMGGGGSPDEVHMRQETDTPLSQSQEKEEMDYLTPVTRVTVTIGRH
ncbi:serine/threonine-protein kinase HSL1 [Biomphalaria pfeifferi]|uniref:non-specific serine/threonine protein kinase n=1 Tax=Biomphalaria pfeifferi TaxID=112525 RepID=A0AAD8FD60_BIOPF|nr:serine/threonine-protein kinase HSL1 [Biomphalaria pfeifferi]